MEGSHPAHAKRLRGKGPEQEGITPLLKTPWEEQEKRDRKGKCLQVDLITKQMEMS